MLTSNPFVESWGHFPRSKARLLDLLETHKPAGLLLLSGDVHMAELMGSQASFQNTLVEVTSSGMTHTSSDEWIGPFHKLISYYFSHNRLPSSPMEQERSGSYRQVNFGTIDFVWGEPPEHQSLQNDPASPSGGCFEHGFTDRDKSDWGTARVSVRNLFGESVLSTSVYQSVPLCFAGVSSLVPVISPQVNLLSVLFSLLAFVVSFKILFMVRDYRSPLRAGRPQK